MIETGLYAVSDERRMNGLSRFDRGGVDDAAAARRLRNAQRVLKLLVVVRDVHDPEVQIRTEDARVDDGERPSQLAADILDDGLRRRRSQCEQRRAPERIDSAADLEKSRAEVVSPLRDAVRFVDDDEVDLVTFDPVDEIGCAKPFGCCEDEFHAACGDRL